MKQCKICGSPIPNTRKSNNTKYCSPKCAREAEAKNNIERISYRAKRANAINHAVYKAYNYKCAICQWQATDELISVNGKIQYAHGNEVHHIEPLRKGGGDVSGNLILLCPNHHKQADLGILDTETLKKHTKDILLTAEEKQKIIEDCTEAISSLIFGE